MHQLLYPQGNGPKYLLDKRLGRLSELACILRRREIKPDARNQTLTPRLCSPKFEK
jgi:hypothetical protein